MKIVASSARKGFRFMRRDVDGVERGLVVAAD